MKTRKQYTQPSTRTVYMKTQHHLLTVSNIGVGEGTKSASESLSRQGSFWDDDDIE